MGACLRCCYKCVDYEPINDRAVDLSHFTLHRVLGRGGFGKVSVAESRLNGELFAIKAMSKRWLLQSASNVKSVWLERHIMIQVRSSFLVHTAYAFQDAEHIYLVMKFLPGGDLHYLLYQGNQLTGTKNQEAPGAKPLPEDHVRFYMVEILLGLEEMHLVGLVYRDLKPENVLLDDQGHVYLSDFGLSGDLNAEADGLTVGACGTPGYQARELLSNHPYDFTPDVYAFGVVMYELLHGGVPGLYEDPRQLRFRSNLSSACIDLLVQLLQHDPNARIGCDVQRTHRWNDVKAHPFFAKVNWDRATRKAIRPPFKPLADTANCDPMYELEEQLRETPAAQPQPLSDKEQAVFKGWEYHTDPVYHSKDHFFEPNEQSLFSLSASGANGSAGASSQHPASISPSGVALLANNKVGASSMSPSFTHSRNPTTEMSILVRPSETARDKDDSASSARSKHLSEEEKAEVERAALAAAAAASLISAHPTQAPSRNKPSRQGQSQTKSNQMGGGAVVHVQPKAVDLHAVRVAMPDEEIKEGNEEEE